MQSILQANIFFFITSMTVVVLGILTALILYHVLGIVRDFRKIADRMQKKSEDIASDLDNIRESVKQEGLHARDVIAYFIERAGIFGGMRPKPPKRKQRAEPQEPAELSDNQD